MDDITRAIDGAADRIIAYRFVRLIETGGILMPLELKRLQGKAMSFRANIEAIGREYDGANEVAAEHLADVKALRAQVSDMKDDLTATVDITKNSVGASNGGEALEKLTEQPKQVTTPPANDLTAAPQIATAPAPVEASPVVEQQPATTFPGQ